MPYRSPSGLLLFYILCLFVITGHLDLQAQAGGRITVTVVNQSTGENAAGQTVTVLRHMNEGDEMQMVAEGVTDRSGRYTFRGLPLDGAHYVVATEYLDVQYMTGHLPLEANLTEHDTSLVIHETTGDDSVISMDALHWIIDVQKDVLLITEILIFRNSGDKSFAPTTGQTGLRLVLPPMAFQFQPMSPGLERTPEGLRYSPPIAPGTAQIIYTYSIERSAIDDLFSQRMAYDTGRAQVLILPSDLSVTGTNVVNEGVRTIENKTYLFLSNTTGLKRGMALTLEFPTVFDPYDMMRWGLVGLMVVIAGIGLYFGLKKQGGSSEEDDAFEPDDQDQASNDGPPDQAEMDELLYAIADLDDQYEAGEIDEKEYQRRRKKLKNQLVQMNQ